VGNKLISVTKTYLPPLEEFVSELEKVWESGWITNNGQLSRELSKRLKDYLGVENLELVANGTLALQLAIKALKLNGEIITTPFSYVATTTAILWEGCDPVFVDIEDKTFCIDADKIENAITDQTSAILATHVYGYPCNVEKIEQIAAKYNLKVIYDAAHAFGVKLKGKSLIGCGDVSVLSLHATKLFHTAEGGALITKDSELAETVSLMKKFGHSGEEDYRLVGINAKISELHAAMGLCLLPRIDQIISDRKKVFDRYEANLNASGILRPVMHKELEYNYAYYPIVMPSQEAMMRVRKELIDNEIMPRRYFHPSLNTLPYLRSDLRKSCPVSESISSRVLCLPIYYGLETKIVDNISQLVRKGLK
jgi:dTDP-4-amino-4,6-dideoxygalactose transaminase